ncbi:MAG: c-type cytochrome [Betaproteobacteria bacterium]|nr:c-type cytochrome [Betaproteobacteria bacterium]
MRNWAIVVAVMGLSMAAGAHADAGLDLARKSGCLNCHAVDKKRVGPSYQEVAAKYKGQASAQARLVAKVTNGGSGVWGAMPMPPKGGNANLSEADIKVLVKWVLSR